MERPRLRLIFGHIPHRSRRHQTRIELIHNQAQGIGESPQTSIIECTRAFSLLVRVKQTLGENH